MQNAKFKIQNANTDLDHEGHEEREGHEVISRGSIPSARRTASTCLPSTEASATRLSLDRSPLTIETSRLATPKVFAITSINSSFAAPSTGGDCSRTSSAPSRDPAMPGLLA